MIRALALLLLLTSVSDAQRPRPRRPDAPPAAAPRPLTFDATVTGTDGRAVRGLTTTDFALTHNGESPAIESVTWVDGARNIVVIADDLGLAPEAVIAMQNRLRDFVRRLAPEDRAALIRTSSGAGRQEQLTAERKPLLDQVDRIQPIARGISDVDADDAIVTAIRSSLEALQPIPGRKAVVILSDRAPAKSRQAPIASAAHATMAVFYFVTVRPADNDWLPKETGGLVVSDLAAVLRDQEGYYLVTFHPEKESPVPAVLQPRGKVLNLRWRAGYTADRSRMAPPPVRPAAGGDVRVHVTALFAGFSPAGYFVDVVAHVDARDLSAVRDLKGINHLSVDVEIAPYAARGKLLGSKPVSRSFDVDDAAFEKIRKVGIGFATRLGLPSAGAYQVRATVADGMSDRVGTAMEVVDLPPRGALAISGLLLKGTASGDDDVPAMAIFHSGDTVALSYSVFNATAGPANESHLSVRTRIYAGGRAIHEGKPTDLQFPAGKGEVRQVSSKLMLDAGAGEGEYAVEVEVTDLLAKQDSPRVATQYRTFQVAQ